MTIHVSAAEFQERIAELLAAARRGEEIVIRDQAAPPLRLAPAGPTQTDDRETIGARRRSAFGMYSHLVGDRDIDVRALKQSDREIEADWERKFGLPR